MGLIDVLNGMQNGPRGERNPSATPNSGSGGMSPITMAILGLLAYKAMKGLAGSQPSAAPANTRVPPGGKTIDVNMPGSRRQVVAACPAVARQVVAAELAICCEADLAVCLRVVRAGSVLTGGLNDLLKQFQQNGHGECRRFMGRYGARTRPLRQSNWVRPSVRTRSMRCWRRPACRVTSCLTLSAITCRRWSIV